MPCIKVLIFFLFQSSAVLCAEENLTSYRSSYFAMRENKQLEGYVVKRFDSPSLLSCGQQCMENAWCTSSNYKMSSKKDGKGTCELNKHDISLINENINFHDQLGVTFSMLLGNYKGCLFTSCFIGGSCFHDKEKQTFSCSCQPLWTGESCEVRMGCPQDWIQYGNSCYYVIDTPIVKWSDYRTICQNLGGDLAIIRSADENNFVLDLLKKQETVKTADAWLGLYRKADNAFYWIDDTPLTGQYTAWADKEPNDVQEKCVHIYAALSRLGKWNDKECTLSDPYQSEAPVVLCQKRLT